MLIGLLMMVGCQTEGICADKVPEEATALSMELVPWDSGPEYQDPNGWTEVIYGTQDEWDTFLSDNGLTDPTSGIDFATSDVLLYERLFNGCEFEVVFDGAYLLDNIRYVRAQNGEFDAHRCDIYEPRHAILVLEKVDGAELEFCVPAG